MSPELLASIAGVILSLVASYVPGINDAYNRLSSTAKRLVMAALLVVAAIGSAIWACSTPQDTGFGACVGGADWRAYLTALVSALVSNQATHMITPKPEES